MYDPITKKFDQRTEDNLKTLDKKAQKKFREFLIYANDIADDFLNCDVRLLSGHRTWDEQNRLYAQGRTLPGQKVTNAKGGQSNHNFGIAGDLGVFRKGDYLDDNEAKADKSFTDRIYRHLAKKAASFGMEAGYNWKTQDQPHFEISTGLTLAEKRAKYKASGTVL